MSLYSIASYILTLAIFIAYANHRYIKMPTTIAIMVSSMLISLVLIFIGQYFSGFSGFLQQLITTLQAIDLESLLLNGMLSFLLFAGALTIDIHTLSTQKWEIFTLATFSTILSAVLLGFALHYLLPLVGVHLALIYCLLFGALISPTDPIAVLTAFKQLKVPPQLNTTVAGESLFNDGVGIVMFISLYHIAFSHEPVSSQSVIWLFLQQAIGGIIYGLLLGYLGSWFIKHVDEHKIEILLTIAIATGGYTLAQAIHVSGPLAMVVAGIIIGSYARENALSSQAQELLDDFWEIIDELLNCVLFLLIGFELLVVAHGNHYLLAGLIAIPLVLLVRFLTILLPIGIFRLRRTYCSHLIKILSWGGLRGGLAVALALSLPPGNYRELILAMTYAVVAFSVIVQGLTIGILAKKSNLIIAPPAVNGPEY